MPPHVEADHHHAVGARGALDEPVAVAEREPGGRVEPDVQSGVQSGNGGVDLEGGRQAQRHGVQAPVRKQFRDVVIAACDTEAPIHVCESRGVDIRGGHDVDVTELRQRRHVLLGGYLAAAGETDSQRRGHRWLSAGTGWSGVMIRRPSEAAS